MPNCCSIKLLRMSETSTLKSYELSTEILAFAFSSRLLAISFGSGGRTTPGFGFGQRKYARIASASRIAKRTTTQRAGGPGIGGRMSSISSGDFEAACARKSQIIDVSGDFLFGRRTTEARENNLHQCGAGLNRCFYDETMRLAPSAPSRLIP